MSSAPRKKSPRAPGLALEEAIEKALRIYDKERRHAAPIDVIAQDLGYKSANNGAALTAIASLRYYGLLERPEEGKLAAAKDVESYQFAPSEEMRHELLVRWLKNPPIFSDLLERYATGLPSDATLRYDLIERGFLPPAAESLIPVFKRSVAFTRYFENHDADVALDLSHQEAESSTVSDAASRQPADEGIPAAAQRANPDMPVEGQGSDVDRIPVRLSGGRRAWLVIPTPFFTADKKRLKDQIDLLLVEDDIAPD